ncbi:intercellular trafficking and secretion [Homalodisca vitripennis]|nr:intercellular trafficking and secretion [Homalodisca vitripennis]
MEINITEAEKRANSALNIREYYTVYLIETKTLNKEWPAVTRSLGLLWRRYTEFEQLRAYLEVTYPWAIVPPLPEKRPLYTWQNIPNDTFDPDFVDRRRAGLENFLHRIAAHPILSKDQIFLGFLQQEEGWKETVKKTGYLQHAETKLRALSIGVRLKSADPRFDDIKSYATGLHGNLHNLLRIRAKLAAKLFSINKLHQGYGRVFSEWSVVEKDMGDGLQGQAQPVQKSSKKWICNQCLSVDVTLRNDREAIEIGNEVTQEIQMQNEIIKTLTEDLNEANEVIKHLKSHIIQLETMVLKKEEAIIMLERRLNSLNIKAEGANRTGGLRSHMGEYSLPIIHSTPEGFATRNSEKKNISSFAMVVKGKKTCSPAKINRPSNIEPTVLSNRFEALSSEEEEENSEGPVTVNSVHDSMKTGQKVNKILICADSHGRDLAWHINKSQKAFEAVGYVRPGGRTKQVLERRNIEEAKLTKDDVLVICCGTNDVARNEADEVIEGVTNILDSAKETKVVIVNLPNRYDLVDWSCVNKAVRETNQRLQELSRKYENVILVEASKAERHWHTRQGLHLNHRGKKGLSEMIMEAVAAKQQRGHPCRESDEQPTPPGTESLLGNASPFIQNNHP